MTPDHEKISNVVVIGAGASADFGVPLGREVLNTGISMARNIATRFKRDIYPFRRPDSEVGPNDIPYAALVSVLQPRGPIDPIDLAEFIAATSSQTVDNFALENGQYSDAARILSASVLVPNLFDLVDARAVRKRLSRLYMQKRGTIPNWIDLFISVVKERIRKEGKSTWSIVSFNYDGIMEHHIRSRWNNDNVHGEFEEIFEFLYPYGKFQPEGIFHQMRDLVGELASSIRFAHEIDRHDAVLNLCWSRVRCARELFILGFACSMQNSEAIGLTTDKYERSCKVVAQNFDGNRVLNSRLIAMGAKQENIFSGDCSLMLDSGYFGDLPT